MVHSISKRFEQLVSTMGFDSRSNRLTISVATVPEAEHMLTSIETWKQQLHALKQEINQELSTLLQFFEQQNSGQKHLFGRFKHEWGKSKQIVPYECCLETIDSLLLSLDANKAKIQDWLAAKTAVQAHSCKLKTS